MKLNTDDQIVYRTWNAQLGWGPLLYEKPPEITEPWPHTKVFKVRITVEELAQEDLPAVSRASHCS